MTDNAKFIIKSAKSYEDFLTITGTAIFPL